MIVHDLYVNRGTFLLAETNSPLLVDSDAELTGSVAGEFLQTITGRHARILNAFGGFEHQQLRSTPHVQVRQISASVRDKISAAFRGI